MSNKPFSGKLKKARTERAEAMPAAIITAIVSSILLLGIAGVTSMVVNGKADAEADVTLTTAVSNIDVSLRSDVTNASYITAGAKLAPPASGTFAPTDLVATGANLHIPEADGKCKVVRWSLEGGQVSRDLTVYSSTNNSESVVSCNTSSTKVAERKKVFSDKLTSTNPFKFYNQVGRELAFNIDESKIAAINTEHQSIRNAQGGAPLNAEQLQTLSNKHLTGNSIKTGFKNPTACPLKDSPATGPCGAVEENIVAAWQSTKISKVSKAFDITMNGTTQSRQVEQNSTVPLYLTAAEAKQAVYGVNTGNKPAKPNVTFPASDMILGKDYPISWSPSTCLASMELTLSYKVYEDNDLVKTVPGGTTSTTVRMIDSSDQYANYTVQAECARAALIVPSDPSDVKTATVTPDVPALVMNAQPAATNAALNSNIKATATCLYGTRAVYGLAQTASSWGTGLPAPLTNLTSVNRAINSGFNNIVNGARYQYQVTAHCASDFKNSATASVDSRSFTTVNPAPTGLRFTAPADKAHSIATNANLTWTAVTCPTGTTPKYHLAKNRNAGTAITAQVLENWTDARNKATSNTNGNEVGYQVKARCNGSAVNSPEISASITYMTKVATPTLTFATTNMIMGQNYSMSWTAAVCQSPVYKTLSYKIYEDNDLVKTVAGGTLSTNVSFTDATDGNANYKVQAECSDGTTVAKSDFSNVRSATVTPAVPTLVLDNQPVATGAALNANIKATATCLHGTKAVYTLKQLSTTYGTAATLSDLASVNRAINNGFTNVVNGARYQYQVIANCETTFRSSGNATVNSRTFTTVNPTPAAIKFTAPTATSNVAINVALVWAKATCPTGTTAKYYMDKTHADGKAITPIIVDNWTTDTTYTTNNVQGTTVEYRVKARCDGTAVNSGETAFSNVRFTTMIAAPGPALNVQNNGHGTVIWYAAAADRRCAAGTTTIYELVQTKRDNNPETHWGGHITGGQAVLPAWNNSNAGYPQWAHVESWCRGANAESARSKSATTKWIPWIDVHVNGWQNWRRMNLYVACPNVHTWVGQARMYVTSEAWNGARQNFGIYTDAGNMIAASAAGPGGNTGWMTIGGTTRTDWIDSARAWGYWEHSGLGVRNNSRDVHATYWNATAWGPWGYWWYGTCTTPYVNATVKGYHMDKPSLAGSGNPWTVYNGVSTGNHRTTAGNNALK